MRRMIGSIAAVALLASAHGARAGDNICPDLARPAPPIDHARIGAALNLLASVTQLRSARGLPVLAANFATSVAINNQATAPQRARALVDTLITNENANGLADGLGATMAKIYRDRAFFTSVDDGTHLRCGEIGPAVTALIMAANGMSAIDSASGKLAFGRGIAGFAMPPGGMADVLGVAYGHPAGTLGAGHDGNARPFQTAPLLAAAGPRILTYQGTDFFGVGTNTRLLLMGATAGDTANGRTGSDLTDSPSYPSGHTTYGYTEALLLAMMVPERFRALAYRGSEYGNSRVVVGAHYPVDVIAGRTLATYDLAQALAGKPGYAQPSGRSFRTGLAAAAKELRGFLEAHGCPDIAACALSDPIVRADEASVLRDGTLAPASTREAYAFRLNYGLPPLGRTGLPAAPIPPQAAALLATRFPYLTDAQRLLVLRSSEAPSGFFLDGSPLDGAPLAAETSAFSRLDLYAAAGGFTSLVDQLVVEQAPEAVSDPDLLPFASLAKADRWSNDISGPGGLTKRGRGTLSLDGANTYVGPTLVEGGTLEVTGSIRSPTRVAKAGILAGGGRVGDVTIEAGGVLVPGDLAGTGALHVDGTLALADGAVFVAWPGSAERPLVRVAGHATVEGAKLVVKPLPAWRAGMRLTLLAAADGVSGRFKSVALDTPSLAARLVYADKAVYLSIEAKESASPARGPAADVDAGSRDRAPEEKPSDPAAGTEAVPR